MMRMPRDHETLFPVCKRVAKNPVRSTVGDDLFVAPRQRVAVEDAVEVERQGPRCEPVERVRIELLAHKPARVVLAVATYEPRLHGPDELESLARQRPLQQIAPEHDGVDIRTLNVREHRLEWGAHSVNVVQR